MTSMSHAQWSVVLLWYSAPTRLNNHLQNDGVILEIYNKVINMAFETSFTFLFAQTQSPRIIFLEAQRWMFMICTDG